MHFSIGALPLTNLNLRKIANILRVSLSKTELKLSSESMFNHNILQKKALRIVPFWKDKSLKMPQGGPS